MVSIRGLTTTTTPATNATTTVPSPGAIDLTVNQGTFTRDVFTAIPEVFLGFEYRILVDTSVRLGYNFLYVPEVAFAGDFVNDGPIRFRDSSFTMHGLDFGVSISY